MMLDWSFHKRRYIVPVFLHSFRKINWVFLPVYRQGICKDVESLVVDVLIDTILTLKTFDDKLQTDLSIFIANRNISFEKLRKGLSFVANPFSVEFFNQFFHLLLGQIQDLSVERVKEPILSLIPHFDCVQAHPMIGNCQHEADHQRFFFIVFLEIGDQLIKFFALIFAYKQILILELPGERVKFKLIVPSEDLKLFKPLQTKLIVSSLKISIQDIFVSPRPFFTQFMLPFDSEQEVLHSFFESPEGGANEDVVGGLLSFDEIEKAESVEGGVIPAEIGSMLLMASTLVHVVSRIVSVRDEIFDCSMGYLFGRTADIRKHVLQDLVPKLPYFFGDNRDMNLWHQRNKKLYLRISVKVHIKSIHDRIRSEQN